jgi:hypothetical protein
MILLTHIIIAITSVVYTTLLLLQPSQAKLYVSYALVTATLASGIYLTVVNPASMLRTCTTGLIYVVIVTAGIAIARKRLTTANLLATEKSQS